MSHIQLINNQRMNIGGIMIRIIVILIICLFISSCAVLSETMHYSSNLPFRLLPFGFLTVGALMSLAAAIRLFFKGLERGVLIFFIVGATIFLIA